MTGATPPADRRRPFVVVTGLSGAGKASVMRLLEDLGYETVDNPPLNILEALLHEGTLPLAVGIDARTRGFDAEAVLDTFPRLLLNETDEVVSCLDACISAMGRFRTFGLRERVHLLRAQRG